jgi:hypothetical protein
MLRRIQRLRDGRESPLTHFDIDLGMGEQVERPSRPVAGGDEDRPIRLVDVPDGDLPREPRPSSRGRDPGDLSLEEEVGADVVRQRPRCQDLPSVPIAGA